MSGLTRTYAPKYMLYEPDGLGRDTYILSNNGGFLKTHFFRTLGKNTYDPWYKNPQKKISLAYFQIKIVKM